MISARRRRGKISGPNSGRGRRFQLIYIFWKLVMYLARRRRKLISSPNSGRGRRFQLIYVSKKRLMFSACRRRKKIWGPNTGRGRRFQLIESKMSQQIDSKNKSTKCCFCCLCASHVLFLLFCQHFVLAKKQHLTHLWKWNPQSAIVKKKQSYYFIDFPTFLQKKGKKVYCDHFSHLWKRLSPKRL